MFDRTRLIAVTIVAALGLTACGGSSQEGEKSSGPFKVGAVFSLTGPAASFGVPEQNALKVLVKDLNASGGVDGRKIEMTYYNDRSDPTTAARGAQELISDGAEALIGATTGSSSLALLPIAKRAGVPVISPSATVPLTDPTADYFPVSFRGALSDSAGIPAIYEEMQARGFSKIGILAGSDALGKYGTDVFEDLAAKSNGAVEVVAVATADNAATDVSAQATKLRNAKPDVVLLQVGSAGLGASFLRAAKSSGLDVPMFGGLGLSQTVVLEQAKGAVDNLVAIGVADPANLTPNQAALEKLLRDAGHEPSGSFGEPFAGSCFRLLVDAIKKAGPDADSATVLKALTDGFTSDAYALQPLRVDAKFRDGYTGADVVFLKVEDGKFVADVRK